MRTRSPRSPTTWLVTGATGLLGGLALRRMLAADPDLRAVALIRDVDRWPVLAARLGALAPRVEPVVGDVTREGLGLDAPTRARLAGRVDAILHAAADTTFSRPLDEARRVNTLGTASVLDLAESFAELRRVVHVSTAFVAGRLTGAVRESDDAAAVGWVNGYERSKAEAEALVRERRAHAGDWLVLRPTTIACDDERGGITQVNAVHQALRVYHRGLAAMMPWTPATALDVVPASWAAEAIAALAARGDVAGETVHLCAGAGAYPLETLLDETYACWARDPDWRRRAIPRPALVDLATYTLFEETVGETGDRRLAQVLRSLSHFVPQLGLPKRFDTRRAEALLDARAPVVRDWWPRMVEELLRTRWGATLEVAA